VSLTYFEFGTLAAFYIFQRHDLDVAVFEVGLGGRLDAVNLLDADVAIVPAIGIDHVEWLGATREAIAQEKAGIFRPGRPAVCSDPMPPQTLIECAEQLGTRLCLLGRDFEYTRDGDSWHWRGGSVSYQNLPRPHLSGDYQFQNAAGVLMALESLAHRLPVPEAAIRRGLSGVKLAGRFQVISTGPVEYVLDVAHNPQAAESLVQTLKQYPRPGKTHALVGMLKDKDCQGFFRNLAPVVDHWALVGLPGARGATVQHLLHQLAEAGISKSVDIYDDIPKGLTTLQLQASPGDRILVTGSFLTVAGAMKHLGARM
jgi:dihydrofolate synthase/folylpolyglutamate synthase